MRLSLSILLAGLLASAPGFGASPSNWPAPNPVLLTTFHGGGHDSDEWRKLLVVNINPRSMTYHRPDCGVIKLMNDENRRAIHGVSEKLARRYAEAMNFRACEKCFPK